MVLLSVIVGLPVNADNQLAVFDTHVHYSQDAWGAYNPEAILEILAAAKVERALVSSTPDDGTLKLYEIDPQRIVPILRPYRSREDMANWYQDAEMLVYVEQRLKQGIYRGIGEFHLDDVREVDAPQIKRIVALAIERDIPLHVHSGPAPVRALFALDARVKILWAHAGMNASPAMIGELLERFPGLTTEVSLRAADISSDGRLDPAWRELLLRHADKVMVGTDTWATFRWPEYAELVEQHRRWLAQLPPDVAEKIAYRNATRQFATRQ
jgi:hypothetical protein